jgi:hypothetical protein
MNKFCDEWKLPHPEFNDLDDMVKKGVAERVGKTGRHTYYIIQSNVQSHIRQAEMPQKRKKAGE